MLSSSARASAGSNTGVCPDVTTCRGPRTECAGLTGTTWPLTRQSHRWRSAVIGPARVRVADVGREQFEEAHAGALAGGSDESWKSWRCRDGNELVHDFLKRRRIRRPASLRSMPIPWMLGLNVTI